VSSILYRSASERRTHMDDDHPFADLPAALVEDVLRETTAVADALLGDFRTMQQDRTRLRRDLEAAGMLMRESELPFPELPTTCGLDGSYALERLLATDLAAAAAVAVEGLTPPSEQRYWPQPRHVSFIAPEPHHAETATVLRAVMLGCELSLAAQAPHDLVLLDATLTLPIIYFNQAISKAKDLSDLECAGRFHEDVLGFLSCYLEILRSNRSDKQYVGLPKYSTRREVGRRTGWPTGQDDRALLTFVLEPGELTTPIRLEPPEQPWHLGVHALPAPLRQQAERFAAAIVAAIGEIHICYYRPHPWLPALRVEMAGSIPPNRHRLATVIYGLKSQCASPAMLEPYPLYLADRTVKALARAVPAFRHVATQRVSEHYDGDLGDVLFGLYGYRTESGR
jgi:hypothetical protein